MAHALILDAGWTWPKKNHALRAVWEINPNLRAVAVINEADPQSFRMAADNLAAASALEEIEGLELAETQIVRRKAFPNAAALGLSVMEYDDAKARLDFSELLKILFVYRKNNGASPNDYRKDS